MLSAVEFCWKWAVRVVVEGWLCRTIKFEAGRILRDWAVRKAVEVRRERVESS